MPNVLRKEDKALALLILSAGLLTGCFHRSVDATIGNSLSVRSPGFASSFATASRASWHEGNTIRTLVNGDEFFPPMLDAVRGARKSITFETFAFIASPVTREFSEALAEKAREGLKVHVIIDGIGSRDAGEYNLALMKYAGVEVEIYHPLHHFSPNALSNRTHRKILVVDGKLGYTGGAGFAHAWTGKAQNSSFWRDTQYEVQGPAVKQLQAAFCENWKELSGNRLQGADYFPQLKSRGKTRAQFVFDSPRDKKHPLAHSVLMAINSSRESLVLAQSYFVPNKELREALLQAAARGVKVEILVPNKDIDSKPSRYASQNYWAELLKGGIRLYQYEATMMHGKLLVADGRLSIVGSGNLDDRSFFINDEVNLHVDSVAFAREQARMFRDDLKAAREITMVNLSEVLEPSYKRFFARFIESHL